MTSILIIEDSEETAFILTHLLGEMGCSVTVCASAASGLAALKEGVFDLVLMDLRLPDMNGTDAALQARDFSDTPIVGLSADVSPSQRQAGLKAGMADVQEKTLRRDDLRSILEKFARKAD